MFDFLYKEQYHDEKNYLQICWAYFEDLKLIQLLKPVLVEKHSNIVWFSWFFVRINLKTLGFLFCGHRKTLGLILFSWFCTYRSPVKILTSFSSVAELIAVRVSRTLGEFLVSNKSIFCDKCSVIFSLFTQSHFVKVRYICKHHLMSACLKSHLCKGFTNGGLRSFA